MDNLPHLVHNVTWMWMTGVRQASHLLKEMFFMYQQLKQVDLQMCHHQVKATLYKTLVNWKEQHQIQTQQSKWVVLVDQMIHQT